MDLPNTALMLKSRDIKVLHLETSDVCQAACPQCARETDPQFQKSIKHNLTVEQLQTLLPQQFVAQLEKMFMCGNYGDPAANRSSVEIYQWFRELNPSIVLGMNSNGALQTVNWWRNLAKILNQPQDYVVFSIDGLVDTNHRYRVGVNWHKLMKNAQAFIDAGGSAHWDMLVYRHNEHQVDVCQQLAQRMGFKWFRAKVTRRPMTDYLQAPLTWQQPTHQTEQIDCHALKERSLYIDAQARVHPCCWLGGRQQNFITDFAAVQASWASSSPEPTCVRVCGAKNTVNNFEQQWQRTVKLN
jgi:sulfatase maturation enzyme AslB (radical SAM superfamily)